MKGRCVDKLECDLIMRGYGMGHSYAQVAMTIMLIRGQAELIEGWPLIVHLL